MGSSVPLRAAGARRFRVRQTPTRVDDPRMVHAPERADSSVRMGLWGRQSLAHAWAAWRVYKIDKKRRGGKGDRAFLARIFQKLLLNFTWWVNRKDSEGRNVFQVASSGSTTSASSTA